MPNQVRHDERTLDYELSALRADLENFGHRFSQIYTDNIIVHKFKNLCSSVFICVQKWKFLYYQDMKYPEW